MMARVENPIKLIAINDKMGEFPNLTFSSLNSQENKTERWLRKEYRMQTFSRSFNLDEKLDSNKISAQYRDGILHLNLPKKEGAQRLFKTIEIK